MANPSEDENRAKDFDIRPASSQYFQKRECNGKNRGVFREIAVAADSSLKVRIVSFTERLLIALSQDNNGKHQRYLYDYKNSADDPCGDGRRKRHLFILRKIVGRLFSTQLPRQTGKIGLIPMFHEFTVSHAPDVDATPFQFSASRREDGRIRR